MGACPQSRRCGGSQSLHYNAACGNERYRSSGSARANPVCKVFSQLLCMITRELFRIALHKNSVYRFSLYRQPQKPILSINLKFAVTVIVVNDIIKNCKHSGVA